MTANHTEHDVPKVADWFQNGFHRFLRTYLKRHFHAIAVNRSTRPDHSDALPAKDSVIVFGNHPSWWDPLIGHLLNLAIFGDRQFYAPIDAVALQQYQVFAKLGFFGVNLTRSSGAAAFLKTSNRILDDGRSCLWITPEGRFADARDHAEPLMPGLAHLCHRRSSGHAVAMAMEYLFWDERLPICLIRFSDPISLAENPEWSKQDWNDSLTKTLRGCQTELSHLAIGRNSEPFDNLLAGKTGAGGIYDSLRRTKSWLMRKKFRGSHGDQFQ